MEGVPFTRKWRLHGLHGHRASDGWVGRGRLTILVAKRMMHVLPWKQDGTSTRSRYERYRKR